MLSKYVDKIYCINLPHRTDRWENMCKEFKKLNIENDVEKITPIKHNHPPTSLKLTNIKILENAVKEKFETILILEDDVAFSDNTDDVIKKIFENKELPDNWDTLYLGASRCGQSNIPIKKISNNLIKLIRYGFSTTAIIYNIKNCGKLINNLKNINQSIDYIYAMYLQQKYNMYMTNPIITKQVAGFSDIANIHRDFDKCEFFNFYKYCKCV